MGKKVKTRVAPGDRERLEALIANGNTPRKHVRRAGIVLLAGVDGLCRDKTRPPGKAPLAVELVNRVLEKTMTQTPPDATHWSLRTMAAVVGIAPSSVQAISKPHGLKPHLVDTFKLSNDPRFAEKVEDVVGLYLNPPERASFFRWTRSPRSKRSTGPSRDYR